VEQCSEKVAYQGRLAHGAIRLENGLDLGFPQMGLRNRCARFGRQGFLGLRRRFSRPCEDAGHLAAVEPRSVYFTRIDHHPREPLSVHLRAAARTEQVDDLVGPGLDVLGQDRRERVTGGMTANGVGERVVAQEHTPARSTLVVRVEPILRFDRAELSIFAARTRSIRRLARHHPRERSAATRARTLAHRSQRATPRASRELELDLAPRTSQRVDIDLECAKWTGHARRHARR
jgi:hypothetical protein